MRCDRKRSAEVVTGSGLEQSTINGLLAASGSRPACLHACLKSAGETGALWVLRSLPRVGSCLHGTHRQPLRHPSSRPTVAQHQCLRRESRAQYPRVPLTGITNGAGALGARLRAALAEFRLARIVKSPAA